ncbi:MAG: hypothetical protein ABS64_00780 [Microbacterium sp. SCN 69-37]|nr:MAG: hypothetical protein ABS64_00780 [Microbacterium sp. SCN 69-37]
MKETDMSMSRKRKILLTSVMVLGLSGLGIGAANAATTPATTPPSHSSTTATEPPSTEAPGAGETPENSATESTVSDGNDGGHQDPEGVDVQNEGGANEK